MIITRELIFERIGESLQEKLESTFEWSSYAEYFNNDGSLVSKNRKIKWPSRLGVLRLIKRKVVMTLWNIMTEEKFDVNEKTRWEVANEIAAIFISQKFIKMKFKRQIEIDETGEISINPDQSNTTSIENDESDDDFMDDDDSDQEFGDDRRYGMDDSEDEDHFGESRDDFYNPGSDNDMDSDEEYGAHSKAKKRQKSITSKKRASSIFEWTPPPSDPTVVVQPELLLHMKNSSKDESKMDFQSLLDIIPTSYRR